MLAEGEASLRFGTKSCRGEAAESCPRVGERPFSRDLGFVCSVVLHKHTAQLRDNVKSLDPRFQSFAAFRNDPELYEPIRLRYHA